MNGENELWKEVLREKYGPNISNLMERGVEPRVRMSSKWWKNIVNIEGRGGINWFNEEVERRVRNRENTKSWYCRWRGGVPFYEKYPRLFAMSTQKEAMVADIWVVNGLKRE